MKVCVLGGDSRLHYLANQLENVSEDIFVIECGNPLSSCEMQKNEMLLEIKNSDILILPIPYSVDGIHLKWGDDKIEQIKLSELYELFHEDQIVFGGAFKADIIEHFIDNKVVYYDFMKQDGFAERNAVATAEGAIAEAILSMPSNLENSNCLVIGYGVCGKEIAKRLNPNAHNVTVMARREEVREEANGSGFEVVPMFKEIEDMPRQIDIVFNTVPARILDAKAIDKLGKDVVIIDIASNPGGTDFDYCQKMGIKAKLCLGIPGKYAPKRSGEIMAEIVANIIL